ncbi:MAG: ribosomal protein S18-alanine N-acetyltransferase [Pseudomonadota bacterium]
MTLSALRPLDLRRVHEIEMACYAYPWTLDSFREVLAVASPFTNIAIRDQKGRVVAYIIFSEVADELHILNVAVDPAFRRYGLATVMLMRVHQQAVRRGRTQAFLEVRESNVSAQKLYAKFGYTSLGRRRDYYSDDHEDAILMVAPLKKASPKNGEQR